MSKFTDFLKLFKWDTKSAADLEEDYDIDTAVNPNWDKIDENAIIVNERLNKLENNGIVSNKYARALPGKVQDTSFEHIYADSPFIENLEIKGNIKNILSTETEEWELGTLTTSTGQVNNSTTRLRTKDYIEVKPSTNYYCNIINQSYCFTNIHYFTADKIWINNQDNISSINGVSTKKITTPENTAYIKVVVRRTDGAEMTLTEIGNIKPTITKMVSEIKIKKCKGNIFDKNNTNYINAYISSSSNTLVDNKNFSDCVYIKCYPNTTYTISKLVDKYFSVAYTKKIPEIGDTVYGLVVNNTGSSITITTGVEAKYLVVRYIATSNNTHTREELLNSLQIEIGNKASEYKPYESVEYTITLPENKFLYIDSCIKKINNKWNLVGNETVELSEATQTLLNSIELYEDINNISIEDGTVSFKYNKSLARVIEDLYRLANTNNASTAQENGGA